MTAKTRPGWSIIIKDATFSSARKPFASGRWTQADRHPAIYFSAPEPAACAGASFSLPLPATGLVVTRVIGRYLIKTSPLGFGIVARAWIAGGLRQAPFRGGERETELPCRAGISAARRASRAPAFRGVNGGFRGLRALLARPNDVQAVYNRHAPTIRQEDTTIALAAIARASRPVEKKKAPPSSVCLPSWHTTAAAAQRVVFHETRPTSWHHLRSTLASSGHCGKIGRRGPCIRLSYFFRFPQSL